jgi:hypothetical protein
VSPIDYRCLECGASFEVGTGSLLTDDYRPGCPGCESEDVQTDWDAVARRFGDSADMVVGRSPALATPAHEG